MDSRLYYARLAMWAFVLLLTVGTLLVCLPSMAAAQETSTPTPTPTETPTETPTSTPAESPENGSNVPDFVIEIVTSTEPSQASEEQLQTVREWFFSNSDSLSETERNKIGSWISEASNSDSSESSDTENTDSENQKIAAEINDNLVLNEYSFDKDNGTVTLVLSADQYTQQLVLTDPATAGSEGVGDVRQKEITVPSGETVETQFEVEYGAYSGSATVWASAGAGDTIYVSNSAQQLIDRLQWVMIPVAGFAAAMSVFVSGLIYVWRKYRSVNKEYTNIFRDL